MRNCFSQVYALSKDLEVCLMLVVADQVHGSAWQALIPLGLTCFTVAALAVASVAARRRRYW